MVTATFKRKNSKSAYASDYLWQYDYGQVLRIKGLDLPTAVEVHFSVHETKNGALPSVGYTKDGCIEAAIPNELLVNNYTTKDYNIYAFVYLTTEASGQTEHVVRIRVKSRPKLESFEKPQDVNIFRQAIDEVNKASDEATKASNEANKSAILSTQNATSTSQDAAKTAEDRKFIEDTVSKIPTIPTELAQLRDDTNHRLVTDAEKTKWNGYEEAIPREVQKHNVSPTSHVDIRQLITDLKDKLNTIANSDDVTLDQMQEIVAYIKNNKSLIDSVTTSKVNVSDVINNLTTVDANKPLSANMGVELKKLIDAIVIPTKISELVNDSDFATKAEVGNVANAKVDKNLGAENVGKSLVVGGDGNVTPTDIDYNTVNNIPIVPIQDIGKYLPNSEITSVGGCYVSVSSDLPENMAVTFINDRTRSLIIRFLNKTPDKKANSVYYPDFKGGCLLTVTKADKNKTIYVRVYDLAKVRLFEYDENGDCVFAKWFPMTPDTVRYTDNLSASEYTPTKDGNIATKKYVDDTVATKLDKSQGSANANKNVVTDASGNIVMEDKPVLPTALSQLTDDATHRVVTDTEKQAWDAKSDFSGDYNDLLNKPEIPKHVTPRVEMSASDTNPVLEPNKLYVFPEMASLSYTLAPPTDTSIVNEYHFIFKSGTTATQVVHPVGVKIGNFKVEPTRFYEVSVMENLLTSQNWGV